MPKRRRKSFTPYKDLEDAGCCGMPAIMSCATCGTIYMVAMMSISAIVGLFVKKKR